MDRDEVMKLALEAGFKRDIRGIYQPRRHDPDCDCSPELERFAELIVREYIDYCGENLSKTVGGALKIHFGVEE